MPAVPAEFEYEFARMLSDAVERVGCIHSVGIAVLEHNEDKLLLTATFRRRVGILCAHHLAKGVPTA